MMRIGSTLRKPLLWVMILLAVFIILSPASLRADACWDAFVDCISDFPACILNPFHLTYCINGIIFCYAYIPN
jgi:hypothetical protein